MKKRLFTVVRIKHTALFLMFIVLFSLSVFFLFSRSSQTVNGAENTPVVIVDAGHGGEDGGAVAADNTNEKDYNLDIALKLEKLLTLNGFSVIMTRTEDKMTCDDGLSTLRERKVSDIKNRFALTEKYSDAMFVSIHQNKFSDPSQHGTQVFYSGNNPKSKALAEVLQNTVTETLQPDNKRLIKESGKEIYILYHAQSPAVLVECGFVSNYEDLNKLKTDEYKTQLAMLIADGIIKYNRMGD